ncbi:hypothetical protein ACH41H_25415 [Streptomyces sp. NPDC020800]|uniref:hypothetical protein n=1 Tax=Streptomyces sp. NPDC020800 TaxID=3365092 RepID=UPI0037AF316D
MFARGRTLRFTAVLTFVVLSLTGFSSGRHHSRHGHGGGGGCSSSHQDHDTSSSSSTSTSGGGSYGGSDDDGYASSGTSGSYGSSGTSGSTGGSYHRRPTHRPTSTPTGSSTPLRDGTARLISCATGRRPYATVEVTNPNSRTAGFQVRVTFYDAEGTELLDNASPVVSVPAQGTATTRVTLGPRFLSSVDHCRTDPQAGVRP